MRLTRVCEPSSRVTVPEILSTVLRRARTRKRRFEPGWGVLPSTGASWAAAAAGAVEAAGRVDGDEEEEPKNWRRGRNGSAVFGDGAMAVSRR